MQVIYSLFALEKFQYLFELISVSFYLFMRVFLSHLLNENDVNIFEIIGLGISILQTTSDQQSEKSI